MQPYFFRHSAICICGEKVHIFSCKALPGSNVAFNLMTTNNRSPQQVVQSPTPKISGDLQPLHTIHTLLKLHHYWDAHYDMDVQKKRKRPFLQH